MNDPALPIGELIRQMRRRAGLSEPELAKALAEASGRYGLTGHAVSRWERGVVIPGPDYRRWLALILDIPAARLDAAVARARMRRLAAGISDPPTAQE